VTDIPKSVWSGSFNVFGVELKCRVLNNGQRIIEADSMADFFNSLADDADAVAEDPNLEEFVKWFRS
jgi:hypothetical protein